MAPTCTGLTATLAGYPYAGFAEPRLIGIFGARKLLCSGWLIGGDEDPNILGETPTVSTASFSSASVHLNSLHQ